MTGRVDVRSAGPVRTLVINRPERSNALTPELAGALRAEVVEAGRDVEIRVVVITGAGKRAFCGGFDLDRAGGGPADTGTGPADTGTGPADTGTGPAGAGAGPAGAERTGTGLAALMASVERAPVPVIAALNGHAIGAGLELACRCDLRVVRRGVRLGMPAVRLGVAYRAGGVAAMLAVTPALRRPLLTGLATPVEEVLGFADALVGATTFTADVAALAAEVAAGAPRATSYLVRVMRASRAGAPDGAAFDEERDRIMAGPDMAEALLARRERRDARFAARTTPPGAHPGRNEAG